MVAHGHLPRALLVHCGSLVVRCCWLLVAGDVGRCWSLLVVVVCYCSSWFSIVRYCSVWFSTVQYDSVLFSIVQYCSLWCIFSRILYALIIVDVGAGVTE